MARPVKEGLDYFPLDVDFAVNDKTEAIMGEFGPKGVLFMIYLLSAVYQNGYYLQWNKLKQMQLANRIEGVSPELANQIVNRLIAYGTFSEELFNSAKVLTSQRIQETYEDATKRRKSQKPTKYWINVDINKDTSVVNVDINPQSKVNKSKSNKSKVNNYDDDAGVTREQVINDWTNLWGFPNGIARPEIDEWLEEFKPEVIAYAIWVAGEHQIRSNACLKYVRAIVAGWKKRNITTLEQAKKAAANHDDRIKSERKPSGYSKPRRKEVTPKWMQKGASQADSKSSSSDDQQDDMSDEAFLAFMNSQEEAK
ncbi:prophage P1 protein 20 [Lactiplantibacillus plantarum]|uniref:Lin1244/Lin1753 domain-containing protein n=1 Tax=Lactiplantibacillus plantarum TaxID=1590 RepID=UPI0009C32320|nr:Lin1244/Lin1753 domain-containing protein [Lactiplantibacillus plantarum]AQY70062.1 DnaD domain protein [Lactiplantibacillus plantarum]MCG0635242.1 prophage P1 protein 20 [Lactiplantibacillus plantarum]MCG0641463.1 prophage P1 protein 20 [Lactiplantibacillus plantarum]MCG0644535.1 prophage P1 protein 20 [Lactiplantibacillus plantarum]MCG0650846.1 prophage P1 protein 20 [Lactiplantibacillus plantarum]